jgi:hypothetical protein
MAEIRVRGAGRDNQKIVGQFAVRQDQLLAGEIDTGGFGQQHLDVLLAPENPANRRRDVSRRQRSHRDLIQQRLEHVMVPPIHDRDLNRLAAQRTRRIQPAEAAADDYHTTHRIISRR